MGRNRTTTLAVDPAVADSALAALAADGDLGAFEELYRRHAQAAWRVAQAVTRNAEDASDAVADAFTRVLKALPAGRLRDSANFRSYLLTATRNAALDVHRRTGRVRPTGDHQVFDSPSGDLPSEATLDKADVAMVAAAFSGLPERWRSVLWLTEVEGIPAREAAGMLGVSANGVAQLAVRARAGLRERFLQAHLTKSGIDEGCRTTVDRLGAYAAGALAPRDLAKVDQHLAACQGCRERLAALEELGTNLRRVVIPIPLGLAALAATNFEMASASAAAATATPAASSATPAWLLKAQRPLVVASVGLFAAGIVGMGVVGQPDTPRGGRGRPTSVPSELAAPPAVAFVPASSVGSAGFGAASTGGAGASSSTEDETPDRVRGFDDDAAFPLEGGDDSLALPTDDGPPVTTTDNPPGDDDGEEPPPPPPPPPTPVAQVTVTVNAGGTTAAVGAGAGDGSCSGIKVGPVAPDCALAPPPDDGKAVTVETGGSRLPTQTVPLP